MLPAPLVSLWAFAGAVAAADGTGGATVRALAGAVAALLRGPQQTPAPAQQLLVLPLLLPRGAQQEQGT